ncbi:SRPBCC family protein [Pseudonocardia sp. KRD-184]|uniref:SRPBCC family protein n=1 Tax=Pseudonocardia oceani TaxID=2792013 RepID=A0ABS6UHD3_9PSEU|nr:SRPBCC family protein [Pseudonocardia oceani]MBW0092018.1 SRPBCC family protein [Pseudonocardia oceani]MBW0097164.1 SRPBCC family protein [Pseudonocardia oceani]MBW0111577.1 SRPBCC family protein [Pseudonocardia oceani]MBW0125244.1 SRPBCC family protein [Pseudonocardia oceani]MBW0131637.1 SRPBCC family protein [Pseudonocardia oceani]
MELSSTFTVSQPVDRAWQVITDLERVAPCLPGAALLGIDGDDYRGAVKIKVGPVTAQYEGIARFAERDDAAHHAVLRAEGRDVRGQGNAAATIDLKLTEQGSGTQVTIDTDLELAGRVAQFGRGVIADVSGKLIGQFATRLEEEMAASGAPAAAPSAAPTPPRSIDDVEPLDLMSVGSGTALKQALPVATALVGLLIGVLLGRRRGAVRPTQLVLNLVLPSNPEEGTR